MGKRKDSVIIHETVRAMLESMPSDSARGQFIMGFLGYGLDGEIPTFEGADPADRVYMQAFFKTCKPYVDENRERYIAKCEKNRSAANMRWKRENGKIDQTDADASSGIHTHAHASDRMHHDTDYEFGYDSESEYENIRDSSQFPPVHSTLPALDLNILKRQVYSVHAELKAQGNDLLSPEDTFQIIAAFYLIYAKRFGRPHVQYRNPHLAKIIGGLSNDGANRFTMYDYQTLIPAYFDQQFKNCDYSMLHFVTGNIRANLMAWDKT